MTAGVECGRTACRRGKLLPLVSPVAEVDSNFALIKDGEMFGTADTNPNRFPVVCTV